jgi:hypothetical protein
VRVWSENPDLIRLVRRVAEAPMGQVFFSMKNGSGIEFHQSVMLTFVGLHFKDG